MHTPDFSRRKFLKMSGLSASALTLGFYFPARGREASIINASQGETATVELNAWIQVSSSGQVTLFSHRAEMGQGVYQSIPQILAEELEVDLARVNIVFAQGDNKKYGNQVTGGSSSIRSAYKQLLKLGASAREMLIEAAARKWAVPKSACYAENGMVIHRNSGRKFHYGELAADAAQLDAPKDVTLKSRSQYKLIGKPMIRRDMAMKVNGSAEFGIDKRLPGLLYAVVERNPRFHGKVKSFDASAALRVPGVKKVVKVRMGVFITYREGVAVIADSTWAAMQGRKVLKVEWDDAGFEHISTEQIYSRQREALQKDNGLVFRREGDPESLLGPDSQKVDAVYETPFEAHACMEPLNCTAFYQDHQLEIWGPIQAPEWVQDYLSNEMKIPREKIIVNLTLLGGAFGRKAFMDYPHEAAVLSKEVGAPVQVVWTREDDMTQGPFRPGISYRCEGLVQGSQIQAARIRVAGQNIGHMFGSDRKQANGSIIEGFPENYFKTIPHLSFVDMPFEAPIPVMWWRSVYASTNGFAFESFLDELAVKAGMDSLALRRKHLHDARSLALLDKLEEISGWKKRPAKAGYGASMTHCFESMVGQVVKVSRSAKGRVQIDKVWIVIDCGWYVNPDTIRQQVEGCVVMALGAATTHAITFRDGLTQQVNFHQYPMPRITDIPPIEIHIMENDADAGGVGEPALPGFAPALTNAIFDLTGTRIRKLPFDLSSIQDAKG